MKTVLAIATILGLCGCDRLNRERSEESTYNPSREIITEHQERIYALERELESLRQKPGQVSPPGVAKPLTYQQIGASK